MSRIDCLKCEHWHDTFGCKYDFRWAANAGGRGVDCKEDVWFCQDYEEKQEENEEEND